MATREGPVGERECACGMGEAAESGVQKVGSRRAGAIFWRGGAVYQGDHAQRANGQLDGNRGGRADREDVEGALARVRHWPCSS